MTSMTRTLVAFLLGALLGAGGPALAAGVPFKIVTASERGTYIQIGRDVARFVAPEADIDLEVLPSAGSSENVQRLRNEPGVKFALVQSDVYQAYIDQADAGNAAARQMIYPLRVITPLYNEEIYFIARADSPLNTVNEIKDAKINVGPLRSGTALSATTLYQRMYGRTLPEPQASYLTNEEALSKLVSASSLDVVVVVAGQPAKLLVDMKPEARALIKLLKFDGSDATGKAALETYYPATVKASNYPNLLAEDLPSLAVKAFLVTYDYKMSSTVGYLNKFARSLCHNFPTLQAQGHAKWKEVDLSLPDLGKGWTYFEPMANEIRRCVANGGVSPVVATPKPESGPTPGKNCTQQERLLGLCRSTP